MTDIYSLTTCERHKIAVTTHDCPPIPDRGADWSAVPGDYDEDSPVGRGPTERGALHDLLTQCTDGIRPIDQELHDVLEAWAIYVMREKLAAKKAYTGLRYSDHDLRIYELGYVDALAEMLGALE